MNISTQQYIEQTVMIQAEPKTKPRTYLQALL
jgi:hypothetical protein